MNSVSSRKPTEAERPPAVVVGVQLQEVSDEAFSSSLRELERLGETLGLRLIGRVTQKRSGLGASHVVGEGKLLELAGYTGGSGVVPTYSPPGSRSSDETLEEAEDEESESANPDEEEPSQAVTVLVDQDLTPTQMRNLEKATGVEVLDRSMVILSIFQRHARTREAKIQVEIARLLYMAPRLREANAGSERQRGGIGGKGAGESALELGRRGTRDRIAELRKSLVIVQREADTQRRRRSQASNQTVALVGYTNAGKSRLMRALTQDTMYVADQLFATLDTTVRVLVPETRPRILVTDTVGFIKDLPHDLVASFRSTLDEARDAGLQLHVVDASDSAFRDQLEVTREVLDDIGTAQHPRFLILNKCDRLSEPQCTELAVEFPDAILMSALAPEDVARLHGLIQGFFERSMEEAEFVIPYDQQAKVGLLHAQCRVLEERYDEDGAHIRVRAPAALLGGFRRDLETRSA